MALPPVMTNYLFLKGMQCPKCLYLTVRDPGLKDKSPFSVKHESKRKRRVAESFSTIFNGEENIYLDREYVGAGLRTSVDFLILSGESLSAYMVKASTRLKRYHILEASFQYYALKRMGLEVGDFCIVYINKAYTLGGEFLPSDLFVIKDVLEEIKDNETVVAGDVERFHAILSETEPPELDIGEHCDTPGPCDFKGHCWKGLPEKSVFQIKGLQKSDKYRLYRTGVVRMKDLPSDLSLTWKQQMQVSSADSGETQIDREKLDIFLSTLSCPLFFMDFETFQPPIPLFKDTRSFEHVPFQYSVHLLESSDSEPRHTDFIAEPGPDPRREFIRNLTAVLGDSDDETIILVYNEKFEKTILAKLAVHCPEYEVSIGKIINRITDLLVPFWNRYFYTPSMNGSASIKAVLPALVPDLSYKDLAIQDGRHASCLYESLSSDTPQEEVDAAFSDLREYCRLDTYAMIRILDKLTQL
jgi:hypothetical protein